MRATTKAAALGAGLGMVAFAVLTPGLASGNARSTVGSGAAAALTARPFVAQLLGGAEEVPVSGDPDGSGQAAVTIDRSTGEVCWNLRVANIATATLAHIHRGARGTPGPVVVDFTSALPNPTSAGCITVAPALATEIATSPEGFYVNVHTMDYPGGAVRGQLHASGTSSGQTRILDAPLRVYDSRATGATKFAADETRTISLANGTNATGASAVAVPPGATAALVRIAVDQTVGAGFLKAYSAALTAEPPTAVLNWYEPNAIVGADAIVAVDALGQIKIKAGVNSTHIIVDVVGFLF